MQSDSAPTLLNTSEIDASASLGSHKDRDARVDRAGLRANMFVTSWSGGKGSCLALDRAKQAGLEPVGLFTMFCEGGERSLFHGLTHAVMRAQAEALGLRLFTNNTSESDYEVVFVDAWREFRLRGISTGVFGNVAFDEQRAWADRVCQASDMRALHPLWHEPSRALIEEFLNKGYRATVVAVRADVLDRAFLGRSLDLELLDEFQALGVDACGDRGEYHTIVTDGPLFHSPLHLAQGEAMRHEDKWLLEVTPVA